nr:unnamed protein product [Callosobruchus analis]
MSNFRYLLSQCHFDYINYTSNTDDLFNNFLKDFLWCFYAAFEKKGKRISNKVYKRVTFSNDLKLEIERMKNMHWLLRQVYNHDLENSYKSLKNEVGVQIKNEKAAYYESLINNSTNTSKTVWNVVSSTIGRKKVRSVSEIIVNAFGEYLSSVIEDIMKKNFHVLPVSCS